MPQKAFRKPFEAPQRNAKLKIKLIFVWIQLSEMNRVGRVKYWNMSILWYKSWYYPYIKNSGKLLIFDILWIICHKIEKYKKWIRKGPLEKDLIFSSTEW